LPPIIVQEKEDDGTSLLSLPLEPEHHESTLILSGRRRARRWVPLNAAIAAVAGAACLASAITALVVRAPAPVTRIVEKRVVVPTPVAAEPTVEAPHPAPQSSPSEAPTSATSEAPRSKPIVLAERAAVPAERKSDGTSAPATKAREWRRDDPGSLDTPASPPRREQRAGFPTNPGF
jgi:hypothetical protein